uniref:ATP synthase F0 subunit 8 n=1 Tax=Plectus sambesii TaxID=2011161 RepID=A0A914VKM5_9BILA
MFIDLNQHRELVFYYFGVCCLVTWFVFNLWILRDYFFPCWYTGGYTASGLSKKKIAEKREELRRKAKISNAFVFPAAVVVPRASTESATKY